MIIFYLLLITKVELQCKKLKEIQKVNYEIYVKKDILKQL